LLPQSPVAAPRDHANKRPTLAAFAGHWVGHTRTLVVTRSGVGKEQIGSGCCDPVIVVEFRLTAPRGVPGNLAATVVATRIRILDRTAYPPRHPAPRVGERGVVRVVDGVFTEGLTDTTYCDPAAETRGVCGA
jgi:hypothetical protein